ncbi:hypothetical protein LCGC14_0378080 [marine sediment metagenome]|uniref:Uncharacterized protein n=1 Tax=marine sediment metagenome TaxID=412755 RepID=A0A0F9T319_9ZZZZ
MITLKQLPTSVKLFVERCDAFIVGSAANPHATLNDNVPFASNIRDIDVVIPFNKWDVACIIIQNAIEECVTSVSLNTYGGMKFMDDTSDSLITIDVWPSDLNKYLLSSLVEYVWNPKFNLRYVKCVNIGDKQ